MLTFWVMVFHDNQSAASFTSWTQNRIDIQRFDGEQVDDTDVDACRSELIGCFQCFVQGHTRTNNCHLIAVTLTNNLL